MATTIIPRPTQISGGFQSFSETTTSNILRTSMENQTIKVRRRTTGVIRSADATMTLNADVFPIFQRWFETDCQGGIHPTLFLHPHLCVEQAWRFSEPPTYQWLDKKAFTVSMKLERLPGWTP